jgi:hypothetical protein
LVAPDSNFLPTSRSRLWPNATPEKFLYVMNKRCGWWTCSRTNTHKSFRTT